MKFRTLIKKIFSFLFFNVFYQILLSFLVIAGSLWYFFFYSSEFKSKLYRIEIPKELIIKNIYLDTLTPENYFKDLTNTKNEELQKKLQSYYIFSNKKINEELDRYDENFVKNQIEVNLKNIEDQVLQSGYIKYFIFQSPDLFTDIQNLNLALEDEMEKVLVSAYDFCLGENRSNCKIDEDEIITLIKDFTDSYKKDLDSLMTFSDDKSHIVWTLDEKISIYQNIQQELESKVNLNLEFSVFKSICIWLGVFVINILFLEIIYILFWKKTYKSNLGRINSVCNNLLGKSFSLNILFYSLSISFARINDTFISEYLLAYSKVFISLSVFSTLLIALLSISIWFLDKSISPKVAKPL